MGSLDGWLPHGLRSFRRDYSRRAGDVTCISRTQEEHVASGSGFA